MSRKINILSTRKLSDEVKSLLDKDKFNYLEENFIKTIPVDFDKDELLTYNNWIVSSKNALKIILNTFSHQELESINFYCVGQQTSQLLTKNKLRLIDWASYAENLAHKIIKNHSTKKFFFIGGEMRRQELPSLLTKLNIHFKNVNLYKTVLSPNEITESNIDGLIFFSPSAIQSYVQKNTIKNETLFCIGNTTATEAKKHSHNIQIPKEQTFKSVIQSVNNYYK